MTGIREADHNKRLLGDAPACDNCGHITVRNCTCYKCLNCRSSMGCSQSASLRPNGLRADLANGRGHAATPVSHEPGRLPWPVPGTFGPLPSMWVMT